MSDELSDDVRARQMGWVDRDEWVEQGKDPDDHITSTAFVEKSENDAALAISSNRKLQRMIDEQQKTMVAMQERMEKAHEAEIKDLKRKLQQAARDGDMEAHGEAMKDLEEAQSTPVPKVESEDPVKVAAQNFIDRVPQFNTDEAVKKEAIALERYHSMYKSDPNEIFEAVEKDLRQKMPEKFGAAKSDPKPRATVTPNGRPTGRKKGLTFDSLPEADKAIYRKSAKMWEGQGKTYTKEQFMKTYAREIRND